MSYEVYILQAPPPAQPFFPQQQGQVKGHCLGLDNWYSQYISLTQIGGYNPQSIQIKAIYIYNDLMV